jgi:hypothetical protein
MGGPRCVSAALLPQKLQEAPTRALATCSLLLLLGGCVTSHSFYLMGRTSGMTGSGVVPANGRGGGDIAISLGGKVYKGRWVYMEAGGSVGFSTTTAFSGAQSATAIGTFAALPTGGNGSISAAAPDGTVLRCAFDFSEWNLKGVGVCQDNHGEIYDLQIS